MKKINLEKITKEHIDNNFDQYSKYLDTDFKVYFELKESVSEVTKCLILEFDKAAITLTNNILVRLLKLSLIYHEVGIKPVPIEKWHTAFDEPSLKYGSLPLGKVIELCKKYNLITPSERDYLVDSVKKLITNGYSNADPGKMMIISKSEMIETQGNHNESSALNKAELNQKIIPPLQSLQIENFTKANAPRYFEFVFELIGNMENRLIEKDRRQEATGNEQ
jgi:hypothetical protein